MITEQISDIKQKATFLGDWLVENKYVTHEQLCDALEKQHGHGGRVGEVLVSIGAIDDLKLTEALGEYLGIESTDLDDISVIDISVARQIPEGIASRFEIIAIAKDEFGITVAMADPLNVVAIDTVSLKLRSKIKTVMAPATRVRNMIELIYHGNDVAEQDIRDLVELEVSSSKIDRELEESLDSNNIDATEAPVVRFVDLMMNQAVKSRASDIHIEPQESSVVIRMRVDGILRDMVPPSKSMQSAVLTRIKILSEMDIAERRLPQDGRFKVKTKTGEVDVRVSTVPTIYGEKIVMRILDKNAVKHDINSIGFDPELLKTIKKNLNQPHGIIIVTGPTGSGKSTTLYSALNYLKDPTKNITTVEDPVEYRQSGINQIQVKPEIDLDFASCLRALLRQDPDIILIGEIRDKETMEIAMKASLTGHLVLSTFHTNDAPSAISRLVYMGLEPYLLSSSMNLIVAQRLIRRVCDKCKGAYTPDAELLISLGLNPTEHENSVFYNAKGCSDCGGSGYKGRLPIFEFLPFDGTLRKMLVNGASESDIREHAQTKGFGNLFKSGLDKALQGLTTVEEVYRVSYNDELNG